jgi:hypothetical protein
MFSSQDDDIIKTLNSSDNNFLRQSEPQSVNDGIFLPSNSISNLIAATVSSSKVNKHYASKFEKEWFSNFTFSMFLRECETDPTKALCIVCSIQFSILNIGLGDINHHTQRRKHQECTKSAEASRCKIYHYRLY